MSVPALRLVPDVDTGDADRDLSPLEQWELYMRGAGRSNRTITETIMVMRRLEEFAGQRLENVRPLDIARYLGRPRLKQNSRAAYFGRIHAFYRWWEQNGGSNPAAKVIRPKAPKGVPRPITTQQLFNLLAIRMNRRTRVMILLGAFAGLRIHEIAKIRGEDVDPDTRTLRVTGKGHVTAVLPLHPVLVDAARGMPRRGWWFPGNARRVGQPIHAKGVGDIIANAMDRAGIPGGTAHRLRHYYGTTLVDNGTDLRTVQTLLRHAHLNTTAGYVLVSDPKRVEAIDGLDVPLPSEAERARDRLRQQMQSCRQSTLRRLSALQPGETMPRARLRQALQSHVRQHLDVVLAELVREGLVAEVATARSKAYAMRANKGGLTPRGR